MHALRCTVLVCFCLSFSTVTCAKGGWGLGSVKDKPTKPPPLGGGGGFGNQDGNRADPPPKETGGHAAFGSGPGFNVQSKEASAQQREKQNTARKPDIPLPKKHRESLARQDAARAEQQKQDILRDYHSRDSKESRASTFKRATPTQKNTFPFNEGQKEEIDSRNPSMANYQRFKAGFKPRDPTPTQKPGWDAARITEQQKPTQQRQPEQKKPTPTESFKERAGQRLKDNVKGAASKLFSKTQKESRFKPSATKTGGTGVFPNVNVKDFTKQPNFKKPKAKAFGGSIDEFNKKFGAAARTEEKASMFTKTQKKPSFGRRTATATQTQDKLGDAKDDLREKFKKFTKTQSKKFGSGPSRTQDSTPGFDAAKIAEKVKNKFAPTPKPSIAKKFKPTATNNGNAPDLPHKKGWASATDKKGYTNPKYSTKFGKKPVTNTNTKTSMFGSVESLKKRERNIPNGATAIQPDFLNEKHRRIVVSHVRGRRAPRDDYEKADYWSRIAGLPQAAKDKEERGIWDEVSENDKLDLIKRATNLEKIEQETRHKLSETMRNAMNDLLPKDDPEERRKMRLATLAHEDALKKMSIDELRDYRTTLRGKESKHELGKHVLAASQKHLSLLAPHQIKDLEARLTEQDEL